MSLKRRRKSSQASAAKRTRNAYAELPTWTPLEDHIGSEVVLPRQSTASLLSLPRELRDQIYHEVWRSKPPFEVALLHKGDHRDEAGKYGQASYYQVFKILYEKAEAPTPPPTLETLSKKQAPPMSPRKPPAPWFLASKQVLSEAMQQFNRQATWTYLNCVWGRRDRQLAAWRPPPCRRKSTRQSPILLTLHGASTILMSNLLTMYVHGEIDANEMPVNRLMFDRITVELLQTLDYGIAGSENLRHLSVVLDANAWRGGASYGPIIVDLELLACFDMPILKTLQVSVHHNDPFRGDERLMEKLKESVAVMGRRIMGSEGSERFEEVDDLDDEGSYGSVEWKFVFSR